MGKQKLWPCVDCRVMMKLVNEDHCKCPECGTEVWFNYNTDSTKDDIQELMQDNLVTHQVTVYDAMIGGQPVKGGGSKSAKARGKKQAMQKPSQAELYNRLAKS